MLLQAVKQSFWFQLRFVRYIRVRWWRHRNVILQSFQTNTGFKPKEHVMPYQSKPCMLPLFFQFERCTLLFQIWIMQLLSLHISKKLLKKYYKNIKLFNNYYTSSKCALSGYKSCFFNPLWPSQRFQCLAKYVFYFFVFFVCSSASWYNFSYYFFVC